MRQAAARCWVGWVGLVLVGCGGAAAALGSGRGSDGATIQVVQDTREQLRADPGARRQDVLFLNNAAALLTGTGDDLRQRGAQGEGAEASSSLAARYAEARSLALDARLALARGDQASAEGLLVRSLDSYPTAEALALLLPALSEDPARVASLCARTLGVAPSDADRYAVIRACRALIPDAPSWISPQDAAWFDAQPAPAKDTATP